MPARGRRRRTTTATDAAETHVQTYVHWLRVGAVAVGVGAAIAAGQGVAGATPPDAADPPSPSVSSDPDSGADPAPLPSPQADGEDVADAEDVAGGVPDSDPRTEPDPRDDPADELTSDVADALPDAESTELTDGSVAGDRDRTPDDTTPALPDAGPDPADTDTLVDALTISVLVDDSQDPPNTDDDGAPPVTLAVPAISPTVEESVPAAAPAVTVNSIVTDVLTWLGVGQRDSGLPLPALPLPSLIESMWLVVRQNHHLIPAIGASYLTGQTAGTAPRVDEAATAGPLTIDLATLTDLLARPGVSVSTNPDGTVDVINGTFSDRIVTSESDAAELLNQLAPALGAHAGFANPQDIVIQQVSGPRPATVYRLRDTVDGVPVVGSGVILVTDATGKVTGLFNSHDPLLEGIDGTPDARMDGYAEAVTATATAYLVSAITQPRLWPTLPFIALSRFSPELVVYSLDADTPPQLAWRVAVEPFGRAEILGLNALQPGSTYYIDADGADAGTVLMATSDADNLDPATTTGTDLLGQLRTFNVERLDLRLFHVDRYTDTVRDIATYQFIGLIYPVRLEPDIVEIRGAIPVIVSNLLPFLQDVPVLRDIPVLSALVSGYHPAAVSGHANMAAVYDYYKDVLGRDSFDGAGAPITVLVDYNPGGPLLGLFYQYKNAYWSPSEQMMVFGDGNYAAALDIAGHEFTHGVVTYVVGGLNGGESGAMNEAYADIMGNFIENKSDAGRWLVSEDKGEPSRDMADPSSLSSFLGPYPDHYADRYTGLEDDRGVHQNSTIFSHAAYLMMTDPDPDTAGVSRETWAGIYYSSLSFINSGDKFSDGRDAVLFAAENVYGFNADQRAVIAKAFDDVGIA